MICCLLWYFSHASTFIKYSHLEQEISIAWLYRYIFLTLALSLILLYWQPTAHAIKVKHKGACLFHISALSDYTFLSEVSAKCRCNCKSNRGSVHQVPITAGWPKTMQIKNLLKAFYTWLVLWNQTQGL